MSRSNYKTFLLSSIFSTNRTFPPYTPILSLSFVLFFSLLFLFSPANASELRSFTLPKPIESFQTWTGECPQGFNPGKRSGFFDQVIGELGQDCIRIWAGEPYQWHALKPECVNLFLERYERRYPELVEVYDIGKIGKDDYLPKKHSSEVDPDDLEPCCSFSDLYTLTQRECDLLNIDNSCWDDSRIDRNSDDFDEKYYRYCTICTCHLMPDDCSEEPEYSSDEEVEVTMEPPEGWSMISLPVRPEVATVTTLFPGAVVVYRYQKGMGYVRVTGGENLEVGVGYWILLDEPQSYIIKGMAITEYTIPVNDGWYMIGGCTLPAQNMVRNGRIDVVYEYTQGIGYTRIPASEPLDPKKGYWILLSNTFEGATFTASATVYEARCKDCKNVIYQKGACSDCKRKNKCDSVIKAVKITSSLHSNIEKDTILFIAAIHGQERPTMGIMIDWIDFLTTHYYDHPPIPVYAIGTAGELTDSQTIIATDYTVKDLLDFYNIWIVPMANPHSWRRGDKLTAYGVNPDRDFEFDWDPSETAGITPFSQPETRAAVGLAESVNPSVVVHLHGMRNSFMGALTPDGKRAKADGGIHWTIATKGLEYNTSWADPLRYVYRGDEQVEGYFEPFPVNINTVFHMFDSLPFLSEQNARLFQCEYFNDQYCPPPMFWAPHARYRAWYDPNTTCGDESKCGHGWFNRQGSGYTWAGLGALSALLETPHKYWSRFPGDEYNRVKTGLKYAVGEEKWWDHQASEDKFRRVAADTFFALNRLVVVSSNPLPAIHHQKTVLTERSNLSVSGIYLTDENGTCDYTLTYWPDLGEQCCDPYNFPLESPYSGSKTIRNGYYGAMKIACKVTNWGNKNYENDFKVVINVEESDSTNSTNYRYVTEVTSGIPRPNHRHEPNHVIIEQMFDFKKDKEYRVSCELTDPSENPSNYSVPNALSETDPAAFTDNNACECKAVMNVFGNIERCIPPTSPATDWKRIWKTNNYKGKSFKAVIDKRTVCDAGRKVKQNLNGYPIGHLLSAIITP